MDVMVMKSILRDALGCLGIAGPEHTFESQTGCMGSVALMASGLEKAGRSLCSWLCSADLDALGLD